jgi:hypothetical protein
MNLIAEVLIGTAICLTAIFVAAILFAFFHRAASPLIDAVMDWLWPEIPPLAVGAAILSGLIRWQWPA